MSSWVTSLLLVILFVVLEYASLTIAIGRLRRRVRKLEVKIEPKDEPVLVKPLPLLEVQPDLNGDVLVGQAAETYRKAYDEWGKSL